MDLDFIWNLFFMFGGVAAMILGMNTMGNNLEKFAGGKMKTLLGKATSNRFAGVGVGFAVTSIIQSSTATTVMLVGFVNIGLLTFAQATNVIMGANIGTTVTAFIVSLQGVGAIDIGAIAAFIGLVGVMMAMFVKNDKVKNIGNIMAGLGLIFVGLEFISTYAKKLMFINIEDKVLQPFVETVFKQSHNPLLLLIIGVAITALVHSSSTITSLMVVLASIGVLSFNNALFLALGSNIGTTITALMVSAGANVNAKRTALVHTIFNLFGCLLFTPIIWIFSAQVNAFFSSIPTDVGMQIAIFHTMFNVVTTIILLPFVNWFVKLVTLIIPDKKGADADKLSLAYIDDRVLNTPQLAIVNTKKEIVRMSTYAKENINLAVKMLIEKQDNVKTIKENEEVLNFLNKGITRYLTKLIGVDLNAQDDKAVGTYFHVVSDLERVGDYAENIMEYSVRLKDCESDFSAHAKEELLGVLNEINKLFDYAMNTFNNVTYEDFDQLMEIEDHIDDVSVKLESKHIDRVKRNACSAEIGSIFLQTVSNLERVADHITNVAKSITTYKERNTK